MRSMVEGQAMLKGTATAVRRARKLRREMSLPEVLLWQALRQRPGGYKFRHQHPAGPYILDFYCDAAQLCVEVDGEAHARGDRPQRDARRDAWLDEQGIKVMRISARDLLADLDGVVRGIVAAVVAAAGPSTTAARRSPSPDFQPGEDFS